MAATYFLVGLAPVLFTAPRVADATARTRFPCTSPDDFTPDRIYETGFTQGPGGDFDVPFRTTCAEASDSHIPIDGSECGDVVSTYTLDDGIERYDTKRDKLKEQYGKCCNVSGAGINPVCGPLPSPCAAEADFIPDAIAMYAKVNPDDVSHSAVSCAEWQPGMTIPVDREDCDANAPDWASHLWQRHRFIDGAPARPGATKREALVSDYRACCNPAGAGINPVCAPTTAGTTVAATSTVDTATTPPTEGGSSATLARTAAVVITAAMLATML